MRTRTRVAEESADLVRRLGRQNVLELACLLLDFGFAVHCQTVGKQALGQAVTANDVARPLTSLRSELHDHAAVAYRNAGRLQRFMARIHESLVVMLNRRVRLGFDQPQLT